MVARPHPKLGHMKHQIAHTQVTLRHMQREFRAHGMPRQLDRSIIALTHPALCGRLRRALRPTRHRTRCSARYRSLGRDLRPPQTFAPIAIMLAQVPRAQSRVRTRSLFVSPLRLSFQPPFFPARVLVLPYTGRTLSAHLLGNLRVPAWSHHHMPSFEHSALID